MQPQRFQRLIRVLDRRQPDLTVLMEQVNKPHNFSAILRSCDAVGVLEAHAVPPARGIILHPETSGGTAKWIRVHAHPDGPSGVRSLQSAGFRVAAADPGPGSVDFRELDYTTPTALLLGAELYGVTDAALALADRRIRIPMVGMARSLNVSVATALILYEAFRQRDAAGFYSTSRLDPERRRRLLFEWTHPEIARILRESGQPYPPLDPDGEIAGNPADPLIRS
jgi:tRNA (guanosine-2'-O-)-methyltransferase